MPGRIIAQISIVLAGTLAGLLMISLIAFAAHAGGIGDSMRSGGVNSPNGQESARNLPNGTKVYYEDWTDPSRGRTVPVKIYLPADASGPLPVVLFSHGLGGSREAASYLCEYWAQHQYICIAMQHPGSDESFWKPQVAENAGIRRGEVKELFGKAVADPRNALNRVGDVHFVLDELERRNRVPGILQGLLDLNEIAIAGHSFGAWTALAASGQRSASARASKFQSGDPRIKAAVYLSPTASRLGDPKLVYGGIAIPGIHFTGTRDDSPIRDTKAEERRTAYDNISRSDQYLVILNGADHMLFGGRPRAIKNPLDEKQQKLVQVASTRFFDAYLKHDEQSLSWLTNGGAERMFAGEGTFESKHPDRSGRDSR